MARKKIAYRKKNQNRFSMFLVTLVVVMLLIAVSIKSIEMKQNLEEKKSESAQLTELIQEQEDRALELEEYRKYVQTDKYAVEVAREKLGLVFEEEIVLKKEDN